MVIIEDEFMDNQQLVAAIQSMSTSTVAVISQVERLADALEWATSDACRSVGTAGEVVSYNSEVYTLLPQEPASYHYTKRSWRGTREIVEFIKVDGDGIMTVTSQIWHRTAKEPDRPNQGPPKSLKFLTANRCDHNRGRHFDRKRRE